MARYTQLYTRWTLEMRRGRVFMPGERAGVAVSGGQDSILLLDFMRQFSRQIGFRVLVVHFNHHLRGLESDADEHFVAQRAADLNLEFIRAHADVGRVAREKRRNLEAMGRELRYRFFFSLVSQGKLDKVATAHSGNDQAETVLLRLIRGTGARGLGGIHPALEGKVVRPFLSLTRAEIESEVRCRQLSFRADSSNLDPRFTRNKVRRELVPWLEKEFNPAIVLLLKNLADLARDDEAYLELQAAEQARPWRIREGKGERIPIRPLAEFPPAIQRRVMRQMMASARGSLKGVTGLHIEALRRFASTARSGKTLILPGGIEACREFEWLVIRPSGAKASGFCFPVSAPGELPVPQLGLKFRFRVAENVHDRAAERTYNNCERLAIDFGKLQGNLVLRTWRAGDWFHPLGGHKALKLKELFLRRRIPRERRRLWPVLLSGNEIIWVRNFPPSTQVAASASSRSLLVIEEEPLVPDSSQPERV